MKKKKRSPLFGRDMKKWGRRKPSSSIFSMSWLSKLKQKSSNSDLKHAETKRRPRLNLEGEGEKTNVGLRSLRYDSDEEVQLPLSRNIEEMWKFNGLFRELPQNADISEEMLPWNEALRERENKEFRGRGRKASKDHKWEKTSRKISEMERKLCKAAMVQEFQQELTRKSKPKTIELDHAFDALNLEETDEEQISEWERLKRMKIKEVMSKREKLKQKKSVQVSKSPKQSSRIRVYSPKMVSRIECRIKALEDMKKAKLKTKKEAKGSDRRAFDSFAMVKRSYDPQRDFRDSMIEMITKKGLRRAEELEELLACYLTLNADEFHDLIIKVFRQVWFELNQQCFGALSQQD